MEPTEAVEAVEALVRAAAGDGTVADLTRWADDRREVPAALLVELLTGDDQGSDRPAVHPRGVRVSGARITGRLDLVDRRCGVRLELVGCSFTDEPQLEGTTLPALLLDDCELPGLAATGVRVEQGVTLRRCRITGKVDLSHAGVGGRLSVVGCRLDNAGAEAFAAELAEIRGDLWFHAAFPDDGDPVPCEVIGRVDISGARISGGLDCGGLTITSEGAPAFLAFDTQIGGTAAFGLSYEYEREPIPCHIQGEVILVGAKIGGTLGFMGSVFEAPGGRAIGAAKADIGGGVVLMGVGPSDAGPLTARNVPKHELRVEGMVGLRYARIGSDVTCNGVTLSNGGGDAFRADSAEIAGDVWFGPRSVGDDDVLPCTVAGRVSLDAARIGGDLVCQDATFTTADAVGLAVGHAVIAGQFVLDRLVLDSDGLSLQGTRIGGWFRLTGSRLSGFVDLRGCSATVLADDVGVAAAGDGDGDPLGSWAGVDDVVLDGFTYGSFDRRPWSTAARFAWLRLTPGFSPGAWDQLQRVFLQTGYEGEARRTAIEKHRDRLRRGGLWPSQRLWLRVLGATTGFGYRPGRAGLWAIGAIAVLSVVVWVGRADVTAADGADTRFDRWTAVAYAVDTFVPVADFDVTGDWATTGWLRPVTLVFVALGWLLGSIFVAGFTRIVRT